MQKKYQKNQIDKNLLNEEIDEFEDFQKEKYQEIEKEYDESNEQPMRGWGEWTGIGMEEREKKR